MVGQTPTRPRYGIALARRGWRQNRGTGALGGSLPTPRVYRWEDGVRRRPRGCRTRGDRRRLVRGLFCRGRQPLRHPHAGPMTPRSILPWAVDPWAAQVPPPVPAAIVLRSTPGASGSDFGSQGTLPAEQQPRFQPISPASLTEPAAPLDSAVAEEVEASTVSGEGVVTPRKRPWKAKDPEQCRRT